jgi:HK97 gp10 family phage protein
VAFASVSVTGIRELTAAVQEFGDKVKRKAMRQATRAACKVVLASARQKVRVRTKLLRKSLGVKIKSYRNDGNIVGMVGPRVGFKTATGVGKNGKVIYENPTQIAHLVEKGTNRAKAYPFLRPALDENVQLVMTIYGNVLKNAIEDAGRATARTR